MLPCETDDMFWVGRYAAVAVLLIVAACSGGQGASKADGSGQARSSAVPTTSIDALPPVTSLKDANATRLKVPGEVDWIITAGGDAWATTEAPAVRRFDGRSARPKGSTSLPDDVCSAMDAAEGSVWVAACASAVLVRVDDRDGSIQARVEVGQRKLQYEGSVGAGEGAVWALSVSPKPTLYKVDPGTNRVVDTFPAPEESAGVRAGLGHVWITDSVNDELVALDPGNGEETGRVQVGPGVRFLAVGEGAVWVLNQVDASVTQVDPKTLKAVRKIVVGEQPVDGGDLAVGGGFVWARITDALVAQIDPGSGKVVARFGTPAGSGSVAADADAVWITAHDVASVWRIPLH